MKHCGKLKHAILIELVLLILLFTVRQAGKTSDQAVSGSVLVEEMNEGEGEEEAGTDYIKWVDFNVSYEALCQAYETDVETYGEDFHAGLYRRKKRRRIRKTGSEGYGIRYRENQKRGNYTGGGFR